MPRPHHSPSSIALANQCERAWGYRYLLGMRDAQPTWEEIEAGAEHTSRQRSLALGTAVHAVLEAHYERRGPDWSTVPGRIALSGAHHLPHPDRCDVIKVEDWINVPAAVRWAGKRDLLVSVQPSELARLGIRAGTGWLLADYKTSKNVKRYAKTAAELMADGQANLYALDAMLATGAHVPLACRWVYFQTEGKATSNPIDFTITPDGAAAAVDVMTARALELDTVTDLDQTVPNPSECDAYGGCPYHHTRGGPCNAQRRIGGIIQARVPRRDQTMTSFAEKFKAMQAKQAASLPAAYGQGEVKAAAPPPEPTPEPEPPPPAKKTRAPKAAPPAAAPEPEPAAPSATRFKLTIEATPDELRDLLALITS